jgi:hypothetical protein
MSPIEQWEMTALSMFAQAPNNRKIRRRIRDIQGRMTPTARDIADAMIRLSGTKSGTSKKIAVSKIAAEFLERGSANRSR